MCWPSCKGAAYLAVSVFIYRALLVVITMISSSITGQKSSYLPLSVIEEWLLQLVYFIPIFTASSFILIGLESNAFTYMLYSTLCLSLTLCLRYSTELAYIYYMKWDAYRVKVPGICLNMTLDLILLLTLLLYAKQRLRNKRGGEGAWNDARDVYNEEVILLEPRIHKDLSRIGKPLPQLPPPQEIEVPLAYPESYKDKSAIETE